MSSYVEGTGQLGEVDEAIVRPCFRDISHLSRALCIIVTHILINRVCKEIEGHRTRECKYT